MSIEIRNVSKRFGEFHALRDVSLDIESGELIALLGPSGCGKTTLLRSIAGFVMPQAGRIRVAGRDITALPPEKRGTAMMFQSYALWPHMTVAENIGYGLKMRGAGRDVDDAGRDHGDERHSDASHHRPITFTTTRFLRWPSNSA